MTLFFSWARTWGTSPSARRSTHRSICTSREVLIPFCAVFCRARRRSTTLMSTLSSPIRCSRSTERVSQLTLLVVLRAVELANLTYRVLIVVKVGGNHYTITVRPAFSILRSENGKNCKHTSPDLGIRNIHAQAQLHLAQHGRLSLC